MMLKIVVLAVLASTAYAASSSKFRAKDPEFTSEELLRYFGVENHEKAPEHEIVYPLVVEVEGKRSVGLGATATSSLELEVEAFGERLHLVVDHDDSHYAPGLKAEIFTDKGIEKVPLRTDCVYTGKVAGENDSTASVTVCDGLMAVIFRNQGRGELYIEPLYEEHAAKRDVGYGHPHVAYKNRPVKGGTYCEAAESPAASPVLAGGEEPPILPIHPEAIKYLELAFVADSTVITAKGSVARATLCLNTLFNAAKTLLQNGKLRGKGLVPKLTFIKLFGENEVGLRSSTDGSTYLATCSSWQDRNGRPAHHGDHWDNAAFVTGLDLSSAKAGNDLAGIAYIGQGCNQFSASLSEFRGLDATNIIVHEIGHNLGMYHDSGGPSGGPANGCPSTGYIMAAHLQNHQADVPWSTCSRSYYDTRITETTCYDDA